MKVIPQERNPMSLPQTEVQALLHKFAAPLAQYASTSPARKEMAEFMVKTLWTAMIAGPEMEEETWKAFREIGGISEDDLKAIQDCYFEQMKATVSEEQLAVLRQRYGLKRKKRRP
jgi:hypothetical protein